MSTHKTNWVDGDTVHAVDLNRIEQNIKSNEEAIDAAKVFIATYGSTPSAEIEAAYQAKKSIFCIRESTPAVIAPLYKRQSATNFVFIGGNMSTAYSCINNSWVTSDVTYSPSSHAFSHTSAGDDPITPEEIGAVSYTEFKEYVDSVSGGNAPSGSSGGLMTSDEREKLSGIEEGANKYVHPANHPASMISGLSKVATSGSYDDLDSKPTIREYSAGTGLKSSMNTSTGNITFSVDSDSSVTSSSSKPVQSKAVYNALANKAASSHSHSTGDITELQNYVRTGGRPDVNTASGKGAHAIGYNTTSSGDYSCSEGLNSVASGGYSHASGYNAKASGDYASFAHGYNVEANAYGAVAFGESVTAKLHQFALGYLNNHESTSGANAGSQSVSDTLFMIGNGANGATRSNAFRVSANGACYSTSGSITTGADFAEYFEWLDGNPDNEDRRGKFVTLDGDKIRFATSEDDYILGIVSSAAAVIGNASSEEWHGQYVCDVFGTRMYQDVEVPEQRIDGTDEVIPAHTVKQWIINPDYNPEEKYISREFRKEWSPVGMVGQIVVVDDGTCQVNGYCKPSVDGVATKSESGYRVMKRIDDNHVKVLVK